MNVPGKRVLLGAGASVLLLSLIAFGINLGVYNIFSNRKTGAWWASVFAALAGLGGIVINNRGLIGSLCAFSVLAVILNFVGAVVDGATSTILGELTTCGKYGTAGAISNYYGQLDPGYEATVNACAQHFQNQDCVCVGTAFSNATTNFCFFFDGAPEKCVDVLTQYRDNIKASAAFDVIILISVFMFSVCTCRVCCCPESFPEGIRVHVTEATAVPVHVDVIAYVPQGGIYYGPGAATATQANFMPYPGIQMGVLPGERAPLVYTSGDPYVTGIPLHQNPVELQGELQGELQFGSRVVQPGVGIGGAPASSGVPIATATAVQYVGGYPAPLSQSFPFTGGDTFTGANTRGDNGIIMQPQQQQQPQFGMNTAQHWQLMSGPDLITANTGSAAIANNRII